MRHIVSLVILVLAFVTSVDAQPDSLNADTFAQLPSRSTSPTHFTPPVDIGLLNQAGLDPPPSAPPGTRWTREIEYCYAQGQCLRYRVTMESFPCPGPALGICLRVIRRELVRPDGTISIDCDSAESCEQSIEIRDDGRTFTTCYRSDCKTVTFHPEDLRICITDSSGTECINFRDWSEEKCREDCRSSSSGPLTLAPCYGRCLEFERLYRELQRMGWGGTPSQGLIQERTSRPPGVPEEDPLLDEPLWSSR